MENQIFLYGSRLWPHHWHRAGLPQVQLALQVLSFSQVDTYDIWGAAWPRRPPAHNSYFPPAPLAEKGVWLWWLDQVCALIRRGCCCFSLAHQGVTVPLIYGLLLKQCSLSPTHYKFTFTYITACILHTNFPPKKEKKKRQLDSLGPRNSRDLLRAGRREKKQKNTHLGNYQRGLFLPFSNCAQMSTAPKKETNLNVKVSIINHLGERGHPASPGSLSVRWQQTKCHAPWRVCWGEPCGRYLAKWDAEFWICVRNPLMERDVNGRRH